MKHLITRIAAPALLVGSLLLLHPAAAGATASTTQGFSSTYGFDSTLRGKTLFHVLGDGNVTVVLTGTSGPARSVDVRIERQVCTATSCAWKGHFVGTTCTRTLAPKVTATCTFKAGADLHDHRLVLAKKADGVVIRGTVKVS